MKYYTTEYGLFTLMIVWLTGRYAHCCSPASRKIITPHITSQEKVKIQSSVSTKCISLLHNRQKIISWTIVNLRICTFIYICAYDKATSKSKEIMIPGVRMVVPPVLWRKTGKQGAQALQFYFLTWVEVTHAIIILKPYICFMHFFCNSKYFIVIKNLRSQRLGSLKFKWDS